MANKHLKGYSPSSVIRREQIREDGWNPNEDGPKCCQPCEEMEPLCVAGGNARGWRCSSWLSPTPVNMDLAYGPAIPSPGTDPRELQAYVHQERYRNAHSSTIQKSPRATTIHVTVWGPAWVSKT